MAAKPHTKRYTVRDGFIVRLETPKADGSGVYTREFQAGEELPLTGEQYEVHACRVELADPKERAAAAEAEAAAAAQQAARAVPPEAASMLAAALAQLMAGATAAAPTPAPAG